MIKVKISNKYLPYIEKVVTSIIQLGFFFYISHVVGPEQFGIYSIIVAITSISELVISSCATGFLQQDSIDYEHNSGSVLIFTLALSCFFLVINMIIGIYYYISNNSRTMMLSFFLLSLSSMTFGFYSIVRVKLLLKSEYRTLTNNSIISYSLSLIISILISLLYKTYLVFIAFSLLTNVLNFIFNAKQLPGFDKSRCSNVFPLYFKFNSKYLVISSSEVIYRFIFVYIASINYNASIVGVVSNARQLSLILPSMIFSASSAIYLGHRKKNTRYDKQELEDVFFKSNELLVISMLCLLLSLDLILIILGNEWILLKNILPFFIFSSSLFLFQNSCLQLLVQSGNVSIYLRNDIVRKALGVLIMFYFARSTVLIFCLSYYIYSIVSFLFSLKLNSDAFGVKMSRQIVMAVFYTCIMIGGLIVYYITQSIGFVFLKFTTQFITIVLVMMIYLIQNIKRHVAK